MITKKNPRISTVAQHHQITASKCRGKWDSIQQTDIFFEIRIDLGGGEIL